MLSIWQVQHIIVEPFVFIFIPEINPIVAPNSRAVVHGVRDVEEVFEEFGGDILISVIIPREFQGYREHVKAVHRHPTRSIGLIEIAATRKLGASVKNTDVVQAEKATLKDIPPVSIFAIDPPREVDQKFVKDADQELRITGATQAPFNAIDSKGGPRMNGWIHIAKGPFVGRHLSVWVHVPFAQQQNHLLLCEIGINQRQRDAMEGQIPSGKPWILPLVRY